MIKNALTSACIAEYVATGTLIPESGVGRKAFVVASENTEFCFHSVFNRLSKYRRKLT